MTTQPNTGIKPLLLPPQLRTLKRGDGRRASYLELFFDLVFLVAIAIWATSLVFAAPIRYVLWGIALAWELSIPTLARRLFTAIPVHASHIPERFALFTIIVLGETIVVVALGTSGSEWELSAAVVAVLGFVAAAAIWWVYFGAGEEVTMSRSPAAILVFTHAHIPLLAALTAFSAGMALAIEGASSDHLDPGARWALAGGAALYLACLTAAQRATEQGLLAGTVRARMIAGLVLVVLAFVGGLLAPVAFMALAATTLVLLIVLKLWTAGRLLRSGSS